MISQKVVQLLMAVFFTTIIVSCGSDKDSSDAGAAKSSAPTMDQKAGSLMDEAKDSASEMIESAEDQMSETLDEGEEALDDMVSDAEDETQAMKEEAESKMEGMMDHMKQ